MSLRFSGDGETYSSLLAFDVDEKNLSGVKTYLIE